MCGETNRYVLGRVKLLKEYKKLLNDQCLIKKMLVHKKILPKHIPLDSVSFFLSFSRAYTCTFIYTYIYMHARAHTYTFYTVHTILFFYLPFFEEYA